MKADVSEAWVKKKIKQILKDAGVWFYMPQNVGMGSSGIPDFIGCKDGIFIAIEAKTSSGTLSSLQRGRLEEICKAGGFAIIVDETGLEKLKNLVTKIQVKYPGYFVPNSIFNMSALKLDKI